MNFYKKNIRVLIVEPSNQQQPIEKARTNDPWELITEPTINYFPVYPIKRQLVAYGLFAGFSIGSIAALIKEKKRVIL